MNMDHSLEDQAITENSAGSEWLQDLSGEDCRMICSLSNAIIFEYCVGKKQLRIVAAPTTTFLKPGVTVSRCRLFMSEKKIIYAEDMARFNLMCKQLWQGKPLVVTELRLKIRNDRYHWCKLTLKGVYNEVGKPLKFIGKVDDIDLQQKRIEQFQEQARRDPMTSFYNKTFIEKVINDYLAERVVSDGGAFIVVDVDNFKMINDTYGHLFGDKVLIEVARILGQSFRNGDLIGRIGGDEFVILMKHVNSLVDIASKAQAICEALRGICPDGKNAMHKISGSLGIARYPQDGHCYSELFKMADQALYATKGFRKNDFTICGTEEKRDIFPMNSTMTSRRVDELFLPSKNRTPTNINLIRLFELLFDTADINQGIQQVIELVGEHFAIDRVSIITGDNDNWQLYYEWCRVGILSRGEQNLAMSAFGDEEQAVFVYSSGQEQQLTKRDRDLLDAGQDKAVLQYGLRENGELNGQMIFEVCNENRVWNELEIESLLIVSKFIGSFLGKINNQNAIEQLAYTDRLTGMWNFNKFIVSAEARLQAWRRSSAENFALICFDIKKFRYINDTFGFDIGDEILISIAGRLKELCGKRMMFARISSDRFIVLTEYMSSEQLQCDVENIMSKSQYFISPKTGKYKLVFCFGIYLICDQNGESLNAMIDKADMARNRAHNGHKDNYVYYNDKFRRKLMKEKELEDLVDGALATKEFIVYYQPKVDLLNGRIKGAEALVRWMSSSKGFMSPIEFIPLFEKNGVITKLDFYVFECVFSKLRHWLDSGIVPVPISVNLSRVHLSDNLFLEKLLLLSDKYQVPPCLIEIELTESAFMDDITNIITTLREIKKYGFGLSIDDFGSGYSSLRLLRDLPVDYLKLDKGFLDKGEGSAREQVIIRHVIQMAKNLGVKVVSEGVETMEQALFLKGCDCDLVQGYLYARPMPVENFEKFLYDLTKVIAPQKIAK